MKSVRNHLITIVDLVQNIKEEAGCRVKPIIKVSYFRIPIKASIIQSFIFRSEAMTRHLLLIIVMVTKMCQCNSGGTKIEDTGGPSGVDSLDIERAIIGVDVPKNTEKTAFCDKPHRCSPKIGKCCPLVFLKGTRPNVYRCDRARLRTLKT